MQKCVAHSKRLSENMPVGDIKRLYNKFRKSANSRKISWEISIDTFESSYTGKCSLTGWDLSMSYSSCTASLDRIDSKKGYLVDNIQWVHTMVNMCKNKYDQKLFIDMCQAISNNLKK